LPRTASCLLCSQTSSPRCVSLASPPSSPPSSHNLSCTRERGSVGAAVWGARLPRALSVLWLMSSCSAKVHVGRTMGKHVARSILCCHSCVARLHSCSEQRTLHNQALSRLSVHTFCCGERSASSGFTDALRHSRACPHCSAVDLPSTKQRVVSFTSWRPRSRCVLTNLNLISCAMISQHELLVQVLRLPCPVRGPSLSSCVARRICCLPCLAMFHGLWSSARSVRCCALTLAFTRG
jgi:hypothetical protein